MDGGEHDMSVLIKGMKMPKGCATCPYCNRAWDKPKCKAKSMQGRFMEQRFNLDRTRQKWCPLVPAADVWPVVRAVWRRYSPFTDTYECSNCGEQVIDQQFRTNFCPNCGADMRIFSTNCKNNVTTGEDEEEEKLMYDELIKRLWECASGECFNCSQYQPTTNASVCQKELMKQAADAIEELQKALEAVNDAHNEGYDVGYWAGRRDYEQKWIPVTVRLPEKYHQVLVYGLNGMQIDYYAGEKSIGGRPLFMISEAKVTHWMPLPEPPKEET